MYIEYGGSTGGIYLSSLEIASSASWTEICQIAIFELKQN